MTRISVGDASLTSILKRQGAFLKAEVQRTSAEMVTGKRGDVGAAVRGDFSPLAGIDSSLARLSGHRAAISEAALFLQTMQNTISAFTKMAGDASSVLLKSVDFLTPAQVDSAAADARGKLGTAMAALNIHVSGRSLFSGVATDTPPLGTADDLLAAIEATLVGATTANDVDSAVRAWFAGPAGYDAFYQGGVDLGPIPIGDGEAADMSVTALAPAFRDTLAGLAQAALLDRGLFSGQPAARAELSQKAGLALYVGEEGRALLAARVGVVEAQIESARTRNSAEETSLRIARTEIASVDPYEASTRLQEVQAQLESLYLITSRVSRLNLAEYLR